MAWMKGSHVRIGIEVESNFHRIFSRLRRVAQPGDDESLQYVKGRDEGNDGGEEKGKKREKRKTRGESE